MTPLLQLVTLLLRNRRLLLMIADIASTLLELLRKWKLASGDDRTMAATAFANEIDRTRIRRLELEVELKKRELDHQRAILELEKARLLLAHADSKRKTTALQRGITEAEKQSAAAGEKAEEVAHAISVLEKVEEAADARDEESLQRVASALVRVRVE
jgi:hypothetical protein